ncbi:hypothetical protein [Amycolatopsis sp. NPDC051903]|uniref:hypothetical protein n=1 Tax=Amycolatopsis sp. NPDC051903 TaxID=3363936 RepID=UPI003796D224
MTDMFSGAVAISGVGEVTDQHVSEAVGVDPADVYRAFEDEGFEKFIRAWLELLDTSRNGPATART